MTIAVSQFQKGRLVQEVLHGKSIRSVARKYKLQPMTLGRWVKIYKLKGNLLPSARKKGVRCISERSKRQMIRWIRSGECNTAMEVKQRLHNELGSTASYSTVWRVLRGAGLIAVVRRKKPWLTHTHKMKRLAFAKAHRNWGVTDWAKVIFTDETKINLFGSDGRRYCWKQRGAPQNSNQFIRTKNYGGGSVMIWACFGAFGQGGASRINCTINSAGYCHILERTLTPSVTFCVGDEQKWQLQQDNASVHVSRYSKRFIARKGWELLTMPPCSPDLNPIENLWSVVKRRMYKKGPFQSKDAVWTEFKVQWDALQPMLCRHLVESMPARIQAVLAARGGMTKY